MCGIAGRFALSDTFSHLIHSQNLAHRGPDESHQIAINAPDYQLEMSVHRLSIVSRDNGQQPIADPRSDWIVSMNGEIYNHPTLSREAAANDFPPQNPSDTATVAALLCYLDLNQLRSKQFHIFNSYALS